MKADTFARLVILETLVEAEIGYFLEHHPPSSERFREGLVARVSDLVDEIDALDAVAAARAYDSIVDFLAELPDDDGGMVEAVVRFRTAIQRTADRAMDEREAMQSSTWAVVLDDLLTVLADEYHDAVRADGEVRPREYRRALGLLQRARMAAERVTLREPPEVRAELRGEMDRLGYAVHARRLRAVDVDVILRGPQRIARRYRPSPLTRLGAFVISQLLRRRAR
ncbi:MAG TPA: hypothetical protein VFH27_13170, partial [Longimicrobiaceae bacterium]|nr:hypothetical protein [Longimicrobiaceae bacterium]